MNAKQIIEDLKENGFDESQILDAMCDGSFLDSEGIDQETAEEIHEICKTG